MFMILQLAKKNLTLITSSGERTCAKVRALRVKKSVKKLESISAQTRIGTWSISQVKEVKNPKKLSKTREQLSAWIRSTQMVNHMTWEFMESHRVRTIVGSTYNSSLVLQRSVVEDSVQSQAIQAQIMIRN
jgi:3'-phosphoadenosine 5'-phosphosulfate sulfotransferase